MHFATLKSFKISRSYIYFIGTHFKQGKLMKRSITPPFFFTIILIGVVNSFEFAVCLTSD